eukprot:gene9975-biopygen18257
MGTAVHYGTAHVVFREPDHGSLWGVGGAGRAQGGGGGGRGVRFVTNPAVARLFDTLLASSRRDANRTRRAQSGT